MKRVPQRNTRRTVATFVAAGLAGWLGMGCATSEGDPPPETLASLARARGIRAGAFVWGLGEDQPAGLVETALREFDMYTLPAFFRIVEPEQGTLDFGIPDEVSERAPAEATFRVHGPVECDLLADWIRDGDFTGEELEAILTAHVTAVVQHYETKYPGRIAAYIVVNEPFSYNGDGCPWHRIGLETGTDELEYVRIALRTARAIVATYPSCAVTGPHFFESAKGRPRRRGRPEPKGTR